MLLHYTRQLGWNKFLTKNWNKKTHTTNIQIAKATSTSWCKGDKNLILQWKKQTEMFFLLKTKHIQNDS